MINWGKQLLNYVKFNIKINKTIYIIFGIGIYLFLILAGLTKSFFFKNQLEFIDIGTVITIFAGFIFVVAEIIIGFRVINILRNKYEYTLLPFNKSVIIVGSYVLITLLSIINAFFSLMTMKVMQWWVKGIEEAPFSFSAFNIIDIYLYILTFFSFFMLLYLIMSKKSNIINFFLILLIFTVVNFLSKFYAYIEKSLIQLGGFNSTTFLLFISYTIAILISSRYKNQYLN